MSNAKEKRLFGRTSIRQALKAWNHLPKLGKHPLTQTSLVQEQRHAKNYPNTLEGYAYALRDVLREAIQLLAPDQETPPSETDPRFQSKLWRAYLIITAQYIKGRPQNALVDLLTISNSVYFEEQGQAIDAIGEILQQREVELSSSSSTSLPSPSSDLSELLVSLRTIRKQIAEVGMDSSSPSEALINQHDQIIADILEYEENYRHHLKERYEQEADYFIPLRGKTPHHQEPQPNKIRAPRSQRRKVHSHLHYRRLIQTEQEIKYNQIENLQEGIDKYSSIILLGAPGSGKTTAIENLAYEWADNPHILPVPLRLSEFSPHMSLEEFILQGWSGSLQVDHWGAAELADNLTAYLKAGRLFFFFDALNEMPRQNYRKQVSILRRFVDQWSALGNRFLITCRVLDYGEELIGLQRIEILPLTDHQIITLLRKELPKEEAQKLWESLTEGKSEISTQTIQQLKTRYASPQLETDQRSLLGLARNPYLLTMMIDIFVADGQLGQSRAELLSRFTKILMSWARESNLSEAEPWIGEDVQREALATLAFETQTRSGFGTLIKIEQVKAVMPKKVQPNPHWPPVEAPSDVILKWAADANIIEMPPDLSSVRFSHQLLQEYFAAHQMLKEDLERLTQLWCWPWLEEEMPAVGERGPFDPLPPPPPTGWEETTLLAIELAPENDYQLLMTLLEVNPVLAGWCLKEGHLNVDQSLQEKVIEALLATIARPQVALRVRINAAEILGYLGDPRIGEMITIPPGEFLTGTVRETLRPLFLSAYQIGRYPLTNVEYAQFIEDKGYKDKRWWTERGWDKKNKEKWKQPRYWSSTRFNLPNQPVIGISWYEGMAYCQWLSAQEKQTYRLPKEIEWEKAARGKDGRFYPWGNQFTPQNLNAKEGEQIVLSTTPIGIYPQGVSPFGVFDCAGNVWEWCISSTFDSTQEQVLRGGSWYDKEECAQTFFRHQSAPEKWYLNRGCRLIRLVP